MVDVRLAREPFFAEPRIRTCSRSVDAPEAEEMFGNVNVLMPAPLWLDEVANGVTTPQLEFTRTSCALYPVTLAPELVMFSSTVYVPVPQPATFELPVVNAKLTSSVVFVAMASDKLAAAAVASVNWLPFAPAAGKHELTRSRSMYVAPAVQGIAVAVAVGVCVGLGVLVGVALGIDVGVVGGVDVLVLVDVGVGVAVGSLPTAFRTAKLIA